MKKTLTILVLSLCIVASLVSGSLAIYQASIEDIDESSVIAKKFYLDANGVGDDYATAVAMAPGETVTKSVAVVNFDGANEDTPGNVTEVGMKLDVTVNLTAASGKSAIPMLITNVYKVEANGSKTLMGTTTGTGTVIFTDPTAFTAGVADTITYQIEVVWPENTEGYNDSDYQGSAYGNAFTVKVTGTQITD